MMCISQDRAVPSPRPFRLVTTLLMLCCLHMNASKFIPGASLERLVDSSGAFDLQTVGSNCLIHSDYTATSSTAVFYCYFKLKYRLCVSNRTIAWQCFGKLALLPGWDSDLGSIGLVPKALEALGSADELCVRKAAASALLDAAQAYGTPCLDGLAASGHDLQRMVCCSAFCFFVRVISQLCPFSQSNRLALRERAAQH